MTESRQKSMLWCMVPAHGEPDAAPARKPLGSHLDSGHGAGGGAAHAQRIGRPAGPREVDCFATRRPARRPRAAADGGARGFHGRPARRDARVQPAVRHGLAADIGATHYRVALASLAGEILAEDGGEIQIEAARTRSWSSWTSGFARCSAPPVADPRRCAPWASACRDLSSSPPAAREPAHHAALDGYPVGDWLRERYGVPAVIDNDVNIAARGEHQLIWPNVEHLLFVKVATGIGCGIVASGHLYRGQQGAAGDIGHIRVSGRDDIICECGNTGCLEAVAAGERWLATPPNSASRPATAATWSRS